MDDFFGYFMIVPYFKNNQDSYSLLIALLYTISGFIFVICLMMIYLGYRIRTG